MKYKCVKDDFFYHINAVLNDGCRFSCSCTKDEMIDFIHANRKGTANRTFKNDTELIKAYLAVQDHVYVRPVQSVKKTDFKPEGKFMLLLLRNDLWKAIEKNVPKEKWEAFIEESIEKILRQEGYYTKKKGKS